MIARALRCASFVVGVAVFAPAVPAFGEVASVAIVAPATGGSPWTGDEVAKLATDLDAMLANDPAIRGAHVGVVAVDTASGATLYARAADDEFQPASTLKLLVGSAALERLTPEFRFRTEMRVVPGAFVDVIAGGDPFLTAADLAAAADAIAPRIASLDARARPKTVVVDATHFDAMPYPAGWTWDDFGQDYAPHVSAAALEENLVHLSVSAGPKRGDLVRVRSGSPPTVVGPGGAGEIEPGSCAPGNRSRPSIFVTATTGSADATDTLDVGLTPGGCIEVVGSLPLGATPEALDAAVPEPVGYLRASTLAALRTAGLAFAEGSDAPGRLRDDLAPAWTHESPPLASFLGPRFWIPSDNLVGELLLKELGFATAGAPGTTAHGVAYEKVWLQSIGVDPATVTLADGCGMSQYDRITPRDLVAILQHDWQGPNRQLILGSLPVGGARGTIEGIAGTAAAGRVFAKTGSMMHVRGLAGYLATLRHGAVTFAVNVDDWNGAYPALAALRARVLTRIVTD